MASLKEKRTEKQSTSPKSPASAAQKLISATQTEKRLTVRMPNSTYVQIEALAKALGVTVNGLINTGMVQYVNSNKDLLN